MNSKKEPFYRRAQYNEKIEELTGERGKDKKSASLRIEDLKELLLLAPQLQSRELDGTPSRDDYNRLRRDVETVHSVLVVLALAIQRRIL